MLLASHKGVGPIMDGTHLSMRERGSIVLNYAITAPIFLRKISYKNLKLILIAKFREVGNTKNLVSQPYMTQH